ncbi:DUF5677 domain-containing protein [Burkholderia cenocepacia]|uniref:DUF5677 domain-containing protein n=1 Tax=Burkholderia cepacia complex TaxID=87882 RepID=UPI00196B5118|nr:DUF5677 domain-containing protein [Burkholderia cenocepacia]MBN3506435.1 hypothetical protein [Burkholderia cenocepacia]
MDGVEKARVLREVSTHAINGLEAFFRNMKVNESTAARLSATLLLTAAEQFRAMLLLLDGGAGTHAAGPVRSMLEGLADMILLSKDATYADQMAFDNAKADAAMFERYLASLGDEADAEEMIASLKSMLAEAAETRDALKAKGYKRQTREEKFELSDVNDLYVSYGILCAFVHSNITALTARHIGEQPTFAYLRPAKPEVIAMLNSIGLRVLMASVELLPSFTDVPEDAVANLKKEVEVPHYMAMGLVQSD